MDSISMPRSLVDLPDELQIKIIDTLLDHHKLLHDEVLARKKLDNEYFTPDDEFQYYPDLVSWSCTSSYFRNLLAPFIFRTVKLRNDEKSGASVNTLMAGPWGNLVEELYFIGTVASADGQGNTKENDSPPDDQGEASNSSNAQAKEQESFNDPIASLPSIVEHLLSDLTLFPNLFSLSLGFTYPYRTTFDEYYDMTCSTNNDNAAPGQAWRDLMARCFKALTQNEKPNFKALEIRQFAWTNTTPLEDPLVHRLLNQLSRLTLSIRGGLNAAGAHINTMHPYLSTMARLDELFLDHLASATHVSLSFSEDGPAGLEGMRHTRLALRADQMSLLRELHLEYIFICPELVSFAAGHASTLEVLSLHNCASSVNGLQSNRPSFYWKDLFLGLTNADLTQLRKLIISPGTLPLTGEETYGREEGEEEEEESIEVEETRRVLLADSEKRLFCYATLDDKYGMWFHDEDENVNSFMRGEDQTTYETLMRQVNIVASQGGAT